MTGFAGEHIWIIGASSGIGRALAMELSSRGARLVLSARREDELNALNAELGGRHHVLPVDVADIATLQAAVGQVRDWCHPVHRVIFMAAVYKPGAIADLDLEATRRMIDVNLMGAIHTVHAVLPLLKGQGHGQLALCASVAGYRGLPNGQPYSATKAALINYAETLRLEQPSIDVRVINPGFVKTPMTDQNDFAMPMVITPDVAARAIADGLLGRSFEIHFPKKFTLLMKLLRILPNGLYFAVARRMAKK